MEKMKVLDLTLKKKWFDMIASGEKKEEYREIKPYWKKRFFNNSPFYSGYLNTFNLVRFRNGYKKDSPVIVVNVKRLYIGYGKSKWGADPMKLCFIIELGAICEPFYTKVK